MTQDLVKHKRLLCQPTPEDLPDSDDTPVDNQLQHLIPGLLEAILAFVWANRMDWFFGVDMGVYYDLNQPAIIPDGFLSLGVPRIVGEQLRKIYEMSVEGQPPILALEVVSEKYRGEYKNKKNIYKTIGVLYYVIYNPFRRKKPHLEVHRLVDGVYVLQSEHPVWMPEINLGIGIEIGTYQGITREWIYWYNEQGERLLTLEERVHEERQRALEERQRALEERQRAQILAERLRELGVAPDSLV
jgi:Uma2 family endonuclease